MESQCHKDQLLFLLFYIRPPKGVGCVVSYLQLCFDPCPFRPDTFPLFNCWLEQFFRQFGSSSSHCFFFLYLTFTSVLLSSYDAFTRQCCEQKYSHVKFVFFLSQGVLETTRETTSASTEITSTEVARETVTCMGVFYSLYCIIVF